MNQNHDPNGNPSGRILLVEDNPTQAKLLEMLLTDEGYLVSKAVSGADAMELLAANRPDLVISDILMPGIDGLELCRWIRGREGISDLPVILITHLDNPADVLLGLEAGADNFITKPYSRENLLSRVRRSLSDARKQRLGRCGEKVEVHHNGNTYSIGTEMQRIVELLLSIYETAVEKNRELQSTQKALWDLNQDLEKRVAERTEELRDKDRMLIQQGRQAAMGEMIGNIAHQWRQPLNSLGLIVQSLPMMNETGELNGEYINSSAKSAMKIIIDMSQTIDDFRNYFRPDKEKTDFHLSEAIIKTISLVKESFMCQQINLEVETLDEPVINGFPNEFAQVLLNILLNARDAFDGREKADRRVTVSLRKEGGIAVVSVKDNAGGIPEEIIDRVFDPYFTTKGPDRGTGVGLYMSKAIIEKNMGGRLTAHNVAGGAEFRIEV